MIAILAQAAADGADRSPLVVFSIYIVGVFLIAALANRVRSQSKSFVSEYFIGNRGLGMWAFAFTYAATSASGGSFMGFPALVYAHGWVVAWWIAGYMVVPIVALGLFAKRINQVGRISGAITVPELLRRRFANPAVGSVATLLVVFFLFFFLLAQFKAGAQIMATLLEDVPQFSRAALAIDLATDGIPWIGRADGTYLLCLVVFATSVILYTAYGGFRAVVWTDVMQGLVMIFGVLFMLVLTLLQTGGLGRATAQLARMTPPEWGVAIIRLENPPKDAASFRRGTWLATTDGGMVRLKHRTSIPAGEVASEPTEILRLTTPEEIARVRARADPSGRAEVMSTTPYARGAGEAGAYTRAPGPHQKSATGFLSVFLALSFFAFWNFAGAGQPSYMIRQMAFNNTLTLRRSIVMVTVVFGLIYFPLVIIFTSARIFLPGIEIYPDRAMPEMATFITHAAGHPWLAGVLVAAPFAAVMSSVDSFLLLVSSGVVRDIYQQHVNPNASERTLARLCYLVTVVTGVLAVLAVLNPPEFLQSLIVFASGGLGACFLVPVTLALYWPRMTAGGASAGMIVGAVTILVLYLIGYVQTGSFNEYNLFGIHPFIWSMVTTLAAVIGVSRASPPPETSLVERYFGR
jgi:sodium/pantothenate symporter